MAVGPWTEEETNRAADMWRQGITAKEIAKVVGRTPNAVIGRMHRLGLGNQLAMDTETGRVMRRGQIRSDRRDVNPSKKKVAQAKAKLAAEKAKREEEEELKRLARRAKLEALYNLPRSKPVGQSTPGFTVEMPIPKGFRGVTLIDLEPNQCRYPVGEGSDITFCGQRTNAGCSYCPECYPICCYWDGPYVRR